MTERHLRLSAALALLLLVGGGARIALIKPLSVQAQATSTFVREDSRSCAVCHQAIWETYQRTGMGRSFFRPTPANTIEDYGKVFYHKPSESYFVMLRREGKYFQRRYQLDAAGRQINVLERPVDYVLGSGNHVRSYVYRTPANKLVELPLAWYAEKGGYWEMNPGYDKPNHDGFRRALSYDCLFCHNAYPELPAGAGQPLSEPIYPSSLPEGIDCQRCHGAGRNHMQLAKTAGSGREAIRKAIVNPARLDTQRQMEVCMQCHLETTSFPLPNSIQRSGRAPFSYQPGEPLETYMLFFDHAPGSGRDDKYEIVNSVYRLRKSACFLQSKGKLGCTTCHNPHDIPRGEAAERHYDAVCRQCHTTVTQHAYASGCTGCHMPKRRTEDVVHVAATDHLIQRRKPEGDLLAERAERHETDATAYRGEVVLYYPTELPGTPEGELDLALAQVLEKSNLRAGIERLRAGIERHAPKRAEYYIGLADALRDNGELAGALTYYQEAVRRDPKSRAGLQKLGVAQRRLGKSGEAVETLKRAVFETPGNATSWHELGLAYRTVGRKQEAVAAFEKAFKLDPDLPEAHNNLGVVFLAEGQQARAAAEFREAIRIQPDYADAHGNLANLLAGTGDVAQARTHFETALRFRPEDGATHYNYGLLLGRMRQYDDAQRELEAAVAADRTLVDARLVLGDLWMAKGQPQAAIALYRDALRLQPESGRAQLGLGTALAATGDRENAAAPLRKAASNADAAIREAATQVLRQIGKER